jgi:hypothetical protein
VELVAVVVEQRGDAKDEKTQTINKCPFQSSVLILTDDLIGGNSFQLNQVFLPPFNAFLLWMEHLFLSRRMLA